MAMIGCSARVPARVEHERVWSTVNLETMRIGEQTILFVKAMGSPKSGEVTLAVLHLSDDEVLKLMRELAR